MKILVDTLNIEALESNSTQRVMIHAGAGKISTEHLSFWIPTFELLGIDFVILTREMVVYTTLLESFPTLTIVYAKSPLDVEAVVAKLESLKAVFYTVNVGKNIHLLRFNHIKHIYIGSKNSDVLSKITKFYRAYDEIFVSSNSQIDKFKEQNIRLGHLKFTKIGKPHLRDILVRERKKSSIKKVLYLPSWEGTSHINNFSSLEFMSEIVYNFQNRLELSLSIELHEKTSRRDNGLSFLSENIKDLDDSSITLIEQIVSEDEEAEDQEDIKNSLELASEFDILICDITMFSLEFLALEIPLFIYIPKNKNLLSYFEKRYISYDYAYIFSSIDELIEPLQQLEKGADLLKEKRIEAMEYWLGCKETKSNVFIKYLTEMSH